MTSIDVHLNQKDLALLDDRIYSDSHDKQRHLRSMLAIADEIDRPLEEIAELYEDILKRLQADARIPDYLPILVTKRVMQRYSRS